MYLIGKRQLLTYETQHVSYGKRQLLTYETQHVSYREKTIVDI